MARVRIGAMACLLAVAGVTGVVESRAAEPDAAGAALTSAVRDDGTIAGTIVETMSAAHSSYMKIDTGTGEVWTVGPRAAVTVGDAVVLHSPSLMVDFRSNILDRTFERIYMVAAVEREGGDGPSPTASGAPPPDPEHAKRETDAGSFGSTLDIERAAGGLTIEEIVRDKQQLEGRAILVRGRVMNFSAQILERNWIRLQDATTSPEGRVDLVVTTSDSAAVGDVVLVRGTVATNQDLGYGYVYDVLVEKARLVVESPSTTGTPPGAHP